MESTKGLEIGLFCVFVFGGIALSAYFFWMEWQERKSIPKNRPKYKSEVVAKDYYKKDEKSTDYGTIIRTYLLKRLHRDS